MFNKSLLLTALLCCSAATFSATYPVVEPDPIEQIKERLESVDVQDYMKTPRKDWSVFKGEPYPVATKTRIRRYIPWYTTEFDILGENGKVMYPKGYTFNPLKYAKYPRRIVIFKLNQLDKIKPLLRPSDELIADSGDVIEAAEKLGRHISLVEPRMQERLGVRVVPSIIEQKGEHFEIKEIDIEDLD
ncbi:TPA: hypothetical protein ACF3XO_004467 [Vibrio parahaemolyticus]